MNRLVAALAALVFIAVSPAQGTEAGWALLREGGQVVLLAHGNAPGTSDPANVDLDNCRTQRNLSDRGRQQARRIGALFAARAERVEQVYSSRYCRCLDTARLAFGDELVEEMEALDPIAAEPERAAATKAAVMEVIRGYSGSGNLVLVTHPENIEALVGHRTREAEAVIVVPTEEGLHVAGRIIFN